MSADLLVDVVVGIGRVHDDDLTVDPAPGLAGEMVDRMDGKRFGFRRDEVVVVRIGRHRASGYADGGEGDADKRRGAAGGVRRHERTSPTEVPGLIPPGAQTICFRPAGAASCDFGKGTAAE